MKGDMGMVTRTTLGFLLALSFLVCGCREKETAIPDPPPEAYVYPDFGDDEYGRRWEKAARTYDNFESIAFSVKDSDSVYLYMGLPHQVWDSEVYRQMQEDRATTELHGELFHAAAIQPDAADAEALRLLCSRTQSFVPYRGPKNCGGYHADWCLVWKSGGKRTIMQFCFGCCEMKATDGSSDLHCDIWDFKVFSDLLDKYRAEGTRLIRAK